MLVASSFNRLGPYRKNAGNQDEAYIRNEILTEMSNVVGSAFLGVTLGCARCHDHKFDPIRQKDYYRIQAFFASTQQREIALSTDAEQSAWKSRTETSRRNSLTLQAKLKSVEGSEKTALERIVGEKENSSPIRFPLCKPFKMMPPSLFRCMSSIAATQPLRATKLACGRWVFYCRMALRKLAIRSTILVWPWQNG